MRPTRGDSSLFLCHVKLYSSEFGVLEWEANWVSYVHIEASQWRVQGGDTRGSNAEIVVQQGQQSVFLMTGATETSLEGTEMCCQATCSICAVLQRNPFSMRGSVSRCVSMVLFNVSQSASMFAALGSQCRCAYVVTDAHMYRHVRL